MKYLTKAGVKFLNEVRGQQYLKGVGAQSTLDAFSAAKRKGGLPRTLSRTGNVLGSKLSASPHDPNYGLGKPIDQMPRSITKRVRDVPFSEVPKHHANIIRAANRLRNARKTKQRMKADLEGGSQHLSTPHD